MAIIDVPPAPKPRECDCHASDAPPATFAVMYDFLQDGIMETTLTVYVCDEDLLGITRRACERGIGNFAEVVAIP